MDRLPGFIVMPLATKPRLLILSIITVLVGTYLLSSDLQRQRFKRYLAKSIGVKTDSPFVGTREGDLLDFWGPNQDLHFVASEVEGNQILFSLSIPGSSPQIVASEDFGPSRPIVLASNGLRIILSLNAVGRATNPKADTTKDGGVNAEVVGGTYREMGSGVEGRWLLRR